MRVAILGFGVEGKDVLQYFLPNADHITIFDQKTEEELNLSAWKVEQGDPLFKNVEWVCGSKYLDNGLVGFDLIVRSPGIRPDLHQIQEAVKKGAKLTSATNIFFEECKTLIIAVTGTKGKGTTSTLIAKALEADGKKVLLAGNIGEPMLSLLKSTLKVDFVVLELSSFQTIDLKKSPHIAVVTNITSDHLDWHKDQEEYEQAKAQLWANQTKNDFLIVNEDDLTSMKLAKDAPGNIHTYNGENNKAEELFIPGKHNVYNANAALLTIKLLGEDTDKAWQGMTNFKGLEHRLEKVDEINGVTYVNDSYATNPEPTIAALKSFKKSKVLILGGSSKAADFTKMAKEITQSQVRGVILIGDEAENIKNALTLAGFKGQVLKGATSMPEIVNIASKFANQGEVVLLSPACASFGLFENYKDRGKQFKQAVLQLKTGY